MSLCASAMSCSVHGQVGSCAHVDSPHCLDWLLHALKHTIICEMSGGGVGTGAVAFIGAGVGSGVGCAVLNVTNRSDNTILVLVIIFRAMPQIAACAEAIHLLHWHHTKFVCRPPGTTQLSSAQLSSAQLSS